MKTDRIIVDGTIISGHQIASGGNPSTPYPGGSISLQKPFFKALGLDLTDMFDGTLNVDISPQRFKLESPRFYFEQVKWIEGFAAEDFSFLDCELRFSTEWFKGWMYYPHPETKTQHFHSDSLVEILMPKIPFIRYGAKVQLRLNANEISLFE